MAALFPSGKPDGVRLVAFLENAANGATDLAFAYEFPGSSILARISVVKASDGMEIHGLFIDPLGVVMSDISGVRWNGKGPLNYVILGCAVVVPLVIIATLVLCIRTPRLARKWLWIVFIFLGFVQLTLNWQTGEISVNPLGVQLLGAGYAAPMLYPPLLWPLLITVSLPIGAILFLIKRHRDVGAEPVDRQGASKPTPPASSAPQ